MELYIVRHGQTDYNKRNIIQGRSDIPLNETGIEQAETLKKELENVKLDIAICSPLIRTKQTAEIILKDRDVEIIYDDRIVERGFGLLEGQDIKKYDAKSYWDFKLNYETEDKVEKISDLFYRTNEFLEDVKSKYKDKNILVVSHGATIRAMIFNLYGFSEKDDLLNFRVPNCSLLKYRI